MVFPSRFQRALVRFGVGLSAVQSLAAPAATTNVVHFPAANAQVPQMLAERAREQAEALKSSPVYSAFSFVDRAPESKITFEQHSVDDALKTWKPAHYDHGSGIAVADVDGDGKPDIYFVNQLGDNQLWRNLGNGQFEDITERAGVAVPGKIHVTASFADIDNDGDPDLFVTTVNMGNMLFENIGGGRFRDITREAGLDRAGHSSGAVFFDFDRDGLLDLFVCNVGVYTTEAVGRGGFHRAIGKAFHGHLFPERTERSVLYRNIGGKKFRDITEETGLINAAWSGDAAVADVNGDGFPDLYVINMQGDDHFFENVGGKRFVDRTAQYFPKTPWGAMGVKFFDFNQDGAFDLFITDMHSDMTDPQTVKGRTTMQTSFEKLKSESWCAATWTDAFLQGASNNIFGNAFYLNRGGGRFEEVSDKIGAETYWPWGFSAGDLNADGYEDVFVTAGMGWPFRYAINSLLLNDRGMRFVDAEFALGVEPRRDGRIDKPMFVLDCDHDPERHELCQQYGPYVLLHGSLSSRSSAIFDLDDDGDLDIVTNEMNDRPMVLISDLAARRPIRYLKVKLAGTRSNRDGIGAVVQVEANGRTWTQQNDGKSGYLSQSSIPLYFGLGNAARVDRVTVSWPSGSRQIETNVTANGLVIIRER